MDIEPWIIITIVTILLVMLLVSLSWRRDIVSTYRAPKPVKLMTLKNLVCVYYLPETMLKIDTQVEVELGQNSEGNVISTKLLRQDFKISSPTTADPTQPYFLKYNSNPFASDELKLAVTDQGLLETTNVTSDDQTAQIISLIAAAPSTILTQKMDFVETRTEEIVRTEVRKFEATFEVNAWETIPGPCTVNWSPIKDADAGFKISGEINGLDKTKEQGDTETSDGGELSGILFRTRSPVTLTIESIKEPELSSSTRISLINKNREFVVPLRRAPFVKRTHDVAIKNGELATHHLVSPSPVKGFISIPIDVAKAIVSIPARLISLRIDTLGRRKDLETARHALAEVQEKNKKFEEERTNQSSELIDVQKKLLRTEAALVQVKIDSLDEIARLERKIQKLEGENDA